MDERGVRGWTARGPAGRGALLLVLVLVAACHGRPLRRPADLPRETDAPVLPSRVRRPSLDDVLRGEGGHGGRIHITPEMLRRYAEAVALRQRALEPVPHPNPLFEQARWGELRPGAKDPVPVGAIALRLLQWLRERAGR